MPDTNEQGIRMQSTSAPAHFILSGQKQNDLLSIMARANEIAGAPDTSGVLEKMLDLMTEVTQADSANYFQFDALTDELVFSCLRGDINSQYLLGLRLNRQLILPGLAINGAQPAVIGDLLTDSYWLHTVDPSSAAIKRNVINLPVTHQDCMLGVVQIYNFQQAELDLLMVLSNRLAIEISHRIEVEQTRQSNQRLTTLIEVLGEVAGTLDRNHLLHLVTENAARLVDAERSSIFLVDPDTNEMLFQVAYRTKEQDNNSTLPGQFESSQAYSQSQRSVPKNNDRRILGALPQAGEFSFFNRSAITAPLHSEPLAHNHEVDRKNVLGGLMALNKQQGDFQEEDAEVLHILASQASTFLQVVEMYESAGELFLGVIKALVTAIDAKDPYTQGHSQRVSDYAVLISRELGLDDAQVYDIRIGSLLHDIGKIGIPDPILLKKGKLTPEEYEIIKRHPSMGINILSQVKLLEPMLPALVEHHERLDGSGYPNHMMGQQISLMGRIVAVADVFDAMTSDRPYRPALSVAEVLTYLEENAGFLFDPACVEALENIFTESDDSD